MTSILSFFLSLALLFSGGMVAENPADYASSSLTISDVSMTYLGPTYELNPAAKLGVATQGNTALLDFALSAGEDSFFPTQIKLSEQGVSVLLGESATAYTFSPTYWNDLNLTAQDEQAFEASVDLLKGLLEMGDQAFQLDIVDPLVLFQRIDELAALGVCVKNEDAVLSVEGEKLPAVYHQYVLDHDTLMEQLEKLIDQSGRGELYHAYIKLISLALPPEEPVQEVPVSLGDLLAYWQINVELTIGKTDVQDVASEYTFELGIHMGGAQPADIRIPMQARVENGRVTVTADYQTESFVLQLSEESTEEGLHADYTFGDDSMKMVGTMDAVPAEGGSDTLYRQTTTSTMVGNVDYVYHERIGADPIMEMEYSFHDETDTTVRISRNMQDKTARWHASFSQNEEDMLTATVESSEGALAWNVTLELPQLQEYGGCKLSFRAAVDHRQIEDRMAGLQERVFDNFEQVNQSVRWYMDGQRYLADKDRLLHEDSVYRFSLMMRLMGYDSLVMDLLGVPTATPDDAQAADGTTESPARSWTFENGELPDAVPLPWPKLNWLPEGYRMETTQIYISDGGTQIESIYGNAIEKNEDRVAFAVTIYLKPEDDGWRTYYIDEKGKPISTEGQFLWMLPNETEETRWSELVYYLDQYSLFFNNPLNSLTLDEAGKIISNLTLVDTAQ